MMVVQKQYGRESVSTMRQEDMGWYLAGRATEPNKEIPLLQVDEQRYVGRTKGALVLYALQDYWGETTFNQTLGHYFKAVASQGPPYTTALEFLTHLRQASPPEYQNLLSDFFEKIILYDLQAQEATCGKTADGNYEVQLKVKAKKLLIDGAGKELEIPINDWVEIGVMGKDGKSLYAAKHYIGNTQKEFILSVPEEPFQAGIDPFFKLIDRNVENNVVNVKSRESNESGFPAQ
jgi:hypothetical protein